MALEVLTGLVAVDFVVGGDHAASVHFGEDQLLLLSCDFALDAKVAVEVLPAGGKEQDFEVDEAFEGLALHVAWGALGKELGSGAFNTLVADIDLTDAGEDVGAGGGHGGVVAGEEGEGAEDGKARHGSLLGFAIFAYIDDNGGFSRWQVA